MRHDPTFWLLARASGLTAYVMLTLSILAGLVIKSRPFRSLKPAAVTDLHRILAMLGLGALAGHATALVLDTTVHVSIAGLFIPGLISYRPVWTSFGILAAELMVLVYASFSVRKRIGTKNWRRLHWATYGLFGLATVHGLAAGTDSSRPWAFGLYVVAVAAVAAATAWRIMVPPVSARARRPIAPRQEQPASAESSRSGASRPSRHSLVSMRAWQRILLGGLLIGAVAVAGIALNFTLLGLTQDAHDPVGKLSPRAVFAKQPTTPTTTTTTLPTTTTGSDGGSSQGSGHAPGPADSDTDSDD